ncbi:hypothetical protein Q9R19_01745 [Microbacterium sp. ARD32]|uniref:hypothetical protein n=1 Tax=Microbacterium sp. ARD32 TaxID=2962577 RepID=UPI0028828B7C|nr:hypothetical protein [Microbacterium sp. ARD32]MDT0156338.1 hypothetical protein [Microbacterium sp. ARD32]
MSLKKVPATGDGVYSTVRVRSGSSGAYLGQVRVWPGGKFTLTIKRANGAKKAQTLTTLTAAVAPQRLKSGQRLTLTMSATGATKVALAASVRVGAAKLLSVKATDGSVRRIRSAGTSRLEFYTSKRSPAATFSVVSASSSAPGQAALKPAKGADSAAPKPTKSAAPKPTKSAAPKPTKTVAPKPTKTVAPKPAAPKPAAPKPVAPKPAAPKPAVPDRDAGGATATQARGLSASNTGVPAGTALKVHNGDIVVNTPNAVISGLEVRGTIRIEAPGVVIKNSKIIGGSRASSTGLVTNIRSGQPFRIVDSELYAATPDPLWYGILGSNFTAERVNIHGVVDPVHIVGNNVIVRSSWLHDTSHWEKDREQGGTPTHDDSIQIVGGTSLVIEGNRLEDAHNAAIQISQSTSRAKLGSIVIRGNYIQGGGCSVNIASTPSPVRPIVEKNVFGPDRVFATCAVTAPSSNAPSLSGNSWYSGGAAMSSYVPR